MNSSNSNRVALVLLVFVLLLGYLATRDTVKVDGSLTRHEVSSIVSGIEEWSSPKLFRQITVQTQRDGTVSAWVREPENRWSVTIFSNSVGSWKKTTWYLLDANQNLIKQ